ncbi:MAG: MFS transporter [Acetobacter sp.]|nr:MFS transporter [Acetobacter sp.]
MTKKFRALFNKEMFVTLVFGFSSGLPLALVFGTLSLWLKDYSIAYRTIGAFSLLRLPYSFKWLWAPVVETMRLPGLGRLGKRRSWALFAQMGLFCSILALSSLTPTHHIFYMAVAALFISFFSATQDIVLDAFRVELFSNNTEQEVDGATIYVLGYRVGNVLSSAGAIGLAAVVSWNVVYFLIALCLLLGVVAVLLAKEPISYRPNRKEKGNLWQYALVEPFKAFMKKKYWGVALLIVFCYRLSDAYFGPMAYPFYADLGFSKVEIAYISKLYGMVATIVGGVLGGYIINRIGLLKGLLLFAVVQGMTTALYIPLYYIGHNVWYLMFTISLENLSSGMATTAIIAFMSILCNKGYTATQYALLSSLPGFARDVFASTSGKVLEMTSWSTFFVISTLLAVPAVLLCWYLYKKHPDYLIEA